MKEKSPPKYSVIIPIYNQEKYLKECLESVLRQKYHDYELVLVNDGSTDKSGNICRHYKNLYPSIINYIEKGNEGLALTRKCGIINAQGEYIISLDSDDYVFDGFFDTLENYSADIILFKGTRDCIKRTSLHQYPFKDGEVFYADDKYALYKMLCGSNKLNNMCFKCVRRSLFVDIDDIYKEAEFVSNGEDIYQSIPLVDNASSIAFCDKVLYYYRPNPDSMTRQFSHKFWVSEKIVCRRRLEYAKKWDPETFELNNIAMDRIRVVATKVLHMIATSEIGKKDLYQELTFLAMDKEFTSYMNTNANNVTLLDRVIVFLYKKKLYNCIWVVNQFYLITSKIRRRIMK